MGLFSKPIKTLDDLFVHTLQDIYYAENQIAKNMPTMVEKATASQLKQAFQTHLTETKTQIGRLEKVFEMHGQPVKAVTCAAMDGILAEAKEIISDVADPQVLDVALLASAQAVEHSTPIARSRDGRLTRPRRIWQVGIEEAPAADLDPPALVDNCSRPPPGLARRQWRACRQ